MPCGEVRTVAEALDDPQLSARDMIIELSHPTLGPVQTLGNPIKLSRTPAKIDRTPPALGEHTEEILKSRLKREAGPASVDREVG